MPDIASRLKVVREGLGLSQQAIAEHCGVTARSQRNYESGERLPDALYLGRLVELGVDVVFVLTGESNKECATADPAEQVLLDNYRRSPLSEKQRLLQESVLAAAGLSKSKLPITREAPLRPIPGMKSMTQKAQGQGNVQIGSVGGSYEAAPIKPATRKPRTK
ncbi:helix-turn-helix domain-containing protein [Comamonas thiooxydans]|uniref:helix-turn-helix domain-containing protein n=1 Tax=Comamonas thiooxydans TaxID=363952 RepID=UPI0013F41998|nr:helix-turn-helix transcriptional regulator [Comamonas thiooxydans]